MSVRYVGRRPIAQACEMRSGELPPAAPPDLELQLVHSARSLVLHAEFGVARDAKHFAGHANSERTPALDSLREASKLRGELPRRVRALEVAGASFFCGIVRMEEVEGSGLTYARQTAVRAYNGRRSRPTKASAAELPPQSARSTNRSHCQQRARRQSSLCPLQPCLLPA